MELKSIASNGQAGVGEMAQWVKKKKVTFHTSLKTLSLIPRIHKKKEKEKNARCSDSNSKFTMVRWEVEIEKKSVKSLSVS